jgi:hypothetical protein
LRRAALVVLAADNRLMALSLDRPITPTAWSRIKPIVFLPAFAYALAYLFVFSALAAIDSSVSTTRSWTQGVSRAKATR